jgi:3-oxoacyl-[acyl-carrier-protein] synthase II
MSSLAPQAADPVITGIGAVTPLGHDVPTTWTRLIAGESGVAPITLFDASELPTRIAAEVKDFDADALLGTKRARRSARFSQLAIIAAREAFADAGLQPGPGVESVADHERIGVVVNTAVSGIP